MDEIISRGSVGGEGMKERKPMSHWIPEDKEAHVIYSGLKRQKTSNKMNARSLLITIDQGRRQPLPFSLNSAVCKVFLMASFNVLM